MTPPLLCRNVLDTLLIHPATSDQLSATRPGTAPNDNGEQHLGRQLGRLGLFALHLRHPRNPLHQHRLAHSLPPLPLPQTSSQAASHCSTVRAQWWRKDDVADLGERYHNAVRSAKQQHHLTTASSSQTANPPRLTSAKRPKQPSASSLPTTNLTKTASAPRTTPPHATSPSSCSSTRPATASCDTMQFPRSRHPPR